MRKIIRSRVAAVTVGALVVIGAGAGGATAGALVTSADIRNQTIQSEDIGPDAIGGSELKDLAVGYSELTTNMQTKLDEPGLSELEADGPYPGATNLEGADGDNSTEIWAANDARHTSWVQCAPGKVALGGGFHAAADAGDAAAKAIQVVVSEPTQIQDGAVVYNAIEGDAAGSFRPNGWMVQGFNTGAGDVVVRPWVVCARIAD